MGYRLFPITFDLMYRSILGRTTPDVPGGDIYRGHRVIIVEGDIVGVPHYAPDPERFRTLMASALGFAADGDPAIRIYFSTLPTPAFDPQRANESMKDYFNSTFVIVRPAGAGDDVDDDDDDADVDENGFLPGDLVCVNFFALASYAEANCPEYVYKTVVRDFETGDAIFHTSGGGEIESVMDGEYELTEDVHYTYDPVTGELVILDDYFEYSEEPPLVLIVTFVGCEPEELTVVPDPGDCPDFLETEIQRDGETGNGIFQTSGGGVIESVMDGEYELIEGVHYTYDWNTGAFVILDAYLDISEGRPDVITVTFVGCEPQVLTINHLT